MAVQVVPTIDDFGRPQKVEVGVGQTYEFRYAVWTRANKIYVAGDLLWVQASTALTPHGEISQSGINWVCRTKHGTAVWATLEQGIARGVLVRTNFSGCTK